jgi:hypothetical protein
MLKNKTLLVTAVIGLLTGCDSSDSDNNVNLQTEPNTLSGTLSVSPWQISDVISKMNYVAVTSIPASHTELCDGTGKAAIETKDFIVGFDSNNSRYDLQELEKAARLTQVALDELVAYTGLHKERDFNISSTDKWVACYKDNASGDGSAFYRRFEFSPESLDFASKGFSTSYVLAKHELFHVIQYSLLPEPTAGNNKYTQYPRWFSEGSAEFFAGKTQLISSATLDSFIVDTKTTPFSINNNNDETEIAKTTSGHYESDMYKMYLTSFNYLVKHGLSFEHIVRLTENSSEVAAFDQEMSVIENELSLPVSLRQLRDDTSAYQEYIVKGWLAEGTTRNAYVDNIQDKAKLLFVVTKLGETVGGGSISVSQDSYTLYAPIPNGTHELYMETATGNVYGPQEITITDGTLGDIDFSDVAACTSALCTQD